MNQIVIIGNLTKDVELTKTQSDISTARFDVAVQRRFANADGTRETDFFHVTAWRATAEFCAKYMKKGNKIAVTGSMQSRSYENKDGVKCTVWEVVAESVENCTPKPDGAVQGSQKPKKATKIEDLEEVEADDDLPF